MLVEDARGDPGRGILLSWSHDCMIGSHESLLLFTHPVAVSVFF